MKITNKILSFILCFAMIVSMGSFVYANAAATEKANGVCGTNAIWKLYDDGTIVISGKDAVADCENGNINSYYEYKNEIKFVVFEEGIRFTGSYAFSGFDKIETVSLPESLEWIDPHCFENCASIKEVNVPDNVTMVGANSFKGCTSLEKVHLGNKVSMLGWSVFQYCENLNEINIPDSLTTIPVSCFSLCKKLKSITLPSTINTIQQGAFEFCTSFEEFVFPYGIKSVEIMTLSGCSNLKKVILPDTILSIKYGAFQKCSSLEEIIIPDSVKEIGQSAFYGCSSAKKLIIGTGVETIESAAFYDCFNIENELIIPDTVQNIGNCAFHRCANNYDCGKNFFHKYPEEYIHSDKSIYDNSDYIVNDEIVYCNDCNSEIGHKTLYVAKINDNSYDLDILNDSCDHDRNNLILNKDTISQTTCTHDGIGYMTLVCSDCKNIIAEKKVTIPAYGHVAGEVINENKLAADCDNDGVYEQNIYCVECGELLSCETINIPAYGHKKSDVEKTVITDSTCSDDGSHREVIICTECNKVLSDKTVTDPAYGHDWIHVRTNDDGSMEYECKSCKEKKIILRDCEHEGHIDDDDNGYCDCCNAELRFHCKRCGWYEQNKNCTGIKKLIVEMIHSITHMVQHIDWLT